MAGAAAVLTVLTALVVSAAGAADELAEEPHAVKSTAAQASDEMAATCRARGSFAIPMMPHPLVPDRLGEP